MSLRGQKKERGESPLVGGKRRGKGRASDAAANIATQTVAKEIQNILDSKGVSMAAVNKEVKRIEREKAATRRKTNKAIALVIRMIERRGFLTPEFVGLLVAELSKKTGTISGAPSVHSPEEGVDSGDDPPCGTDLDGDDVGSEETRAPPQVLSEGALAKRNELVVKNRRLVYFTIKKFFSIILATKSVPFDDMVGYGVLGLIKAAERHDPAKAKFSTYALWWIRQSIDRGIKDREYMIRIPAHRIEEYRRREKLSRERAGNTSLQGKEEGAHLEEGELDMFRIISFDGPMGGRDDNSEMKEFIPSPLPSPEENLSLFQGEQKRKDMIALLESRLSLPEWHVLKRRFGLEDDTPCTLEEIGAELGVTRERIRQIEIKALSCARKILQKGGRLVTNG